MRRSRAILPAFGLLVLSLVLAAPAVAAGDHVGNVVGHRGGFKSSGVPQNSYAAFAWLTSRGHAVEADARMTRDKKFVLFHDARIGRTCTRKKRNRIEQMTYRQVLRMRCYDGRRLTTLPQVLNLLRSRPGSTMWLESKHRPGLGKRKATVQNRLLARQVRRARLGSRVVFYDRRNALLPAIRAELPRARLAYLVTGRPTAAAIARAANLRTQILSYPARYSSEAVNELAHRRGLLVHNRLVRTPDQAAALIAAGAQTVSSNDPVLLVSQWPQAPTTPPEEDVDPSDAAEPTEQAEPETPVDPEVPADPDAPVEPVS